MIGSFGIHSINWSNKTCCFGYWLSREFQGMGYASEVVLLGEKIALELGFHRLLVTCDRLNEKSQRVPLRCGYKLESLQIDECIDRGRNRDTLQFVKLLNSSIKGRITENLPTGFSIAEVSSEEFNKIVGDLKKHIFEKTELNMWPQDVMSDQEKASLLSLNTTYKNNFNLYLVLFFGEQLAGWSYGHQDTKESFCMASSAILPEHRGRRLYSCLLEIVLRILHEKGFQRIWSSHKMSNNRIIIPKLKRGFVITGVRLSDMAGALVELTYFTNKKRQKILDFRVGSRRPDEEIKRILKI